jgi:PTS system mannose-specific IIA component
MIGLLVVSHGRLGEELVAAARGIVASPGRMSAISIAWDDDVRESSDRIDRALCELDEGDGIIIATDMLGGTPSNVAMAFLEPGRIEVLTGVNLPMVIKFNNLPGEIGIDEAAALLADKGKSHITIAGQILAGRDDDE